MHSSNHFVEHKEKTLKQPLKDKNSTTKKVAELILKSK
ncbi:hypothetical protein B4134_0528 [Bacillus safensis]|nr:hypothetical protein B4134_0528 [Bacillus safensis]